ncbi:hypothetical protein CDD83_5976 [Cordyceps sp. RAO-2017]|nr:hypothetical protein CDD83_5976 [Cordyceps sp. RAO-2017]
MSASRRNDGLIYTRALRVDDDDARPAERRAGRSSGRKPGRESLLVLRPRPPPSSTPRPRPLAPGPAPPVSVRLHIGPAQWVGQLWLERESSRESHDGGWANSSAWARWGPGEGLRRSNRTLGPTMRIPGFGSHTRTRWTGRVEQAAPLVWLRPRDARRAAVRDSPSEWYGSGSTMRVCRGGGTGTRERTTETGESREGRWQVARCPRTVCAAERGEESRGDGTRAFQQEAQREKTTHSRPNHYRRRPCHDPRGRSSCAQNQNRVPGARLVGRSIDDGRLAAGGTRMRWWLIRPPDAAGLGCIRPGEGKGW